MKRFIPSKLKKILRPLYLLAKLLIKDWERKVYHQYFPPKPEVINLNANDICNSKCTMCNIWQQKQDIEITPLELENILKNELFSNVKHIGITGGEPTMREDLPLLYEAACKAIPNLKALSIITNAIRKNDVIKRVTEVKQVCDHYGKGFTMMVSLDGYGKIHEKIRGREGNFQSAIDVIEHFSKNTNIPIAIGCTISKDNVWEVDELLDFLRENKIYGRFRVAEYIKRLYNNDRADVIRNFTEEEKYHLQCFFQKLILTYETSETYQRTYKSIISILSNKKRTIACPYQAKGAVLDSRGDIYYCAPKSKKIGNTIKDSAIKLFNKNTDERRRIIDEDCSDCIHDYHAPITYTEKLNQYKEIFWTQLFRIDQLYKAPLFKNILKLYPALNKQTKHVYIVGWYGTETVGDKAILGGIFDFYKQKYNNNVAFYISSIYTFVTEKTIKELGFPDAKVIPFHSFDFIKYASKADETVMGGGPLMDMEALAIPLWSFKIAKLFQKKTVVFGCGLGPLKNPKYVKAVQQILALSDEIKLRDSKSVEYAKSTLGINRNDIINSGDSAADYISTIAKHYEHLDKKPVLACFLREWTNEYQGDLSNEEFILNREKFEKNLATTIKEICEIHHLTPSFYSMHTFVVGNDDRDFYRRFLKKYFSNDEYYLHNQNANIETTVHAMKTSSINLCMRFHSVLFASTLDTNFLAIDYTNGGKITGFLTDASALDKMISLQSIADNDTAAINNWINNSKIQ